MEISAAPPSALLRPDGKAGRAWSRRSGSNRRPTPYRAGPPRTPGRNKGCAGPGPQGPDAASGCGFGAVVAGGREHRRRAGVVDPYPGHSTVWKCLDPDRWGTVLQGVGDGLPHRNHDVIGVVPGYPGVVSYGRVVAAPLWFLAAYLWVVLLI